jgi:hypothetical protein
MDLSVGVNLESGLYWIQQRESLSKRNLKRNNPQIAQITIG